MGCSSTLMKDERHKVQLKIDIRDEIIQTIFKNPFYNVHVKDFRKFMKNIQKKNELNITKDYIMDLIIEKYIQNKSDIYVFKTVVNFAFDKMNYVFHERESDEEIIPIIFNIIFIFLTQRQKGIKKEMKIDLCILFEKLKLEVMVTEKSEKIKFKSGKFSFLILNLIQLCSFCFLNFFCGPATLKAAANFSQNDIDIVFSDNQMKMKMKTYLPENINRIVNRYLNDVNAIIQPDIINSLILTQALQPISDYISENKDEEIFWIDSLKLIEIFDILIDKMDYEYYIDLFFNTDEEQ